MALDFCRIHYGCMWIKLIFTKRISEIFFIFYLSTTNYDDDDDEDDIHYRRHRNHHTQTYFAKRGVHFYSWFIYFFIIKKS